MTKARKRRGKEFSGLPSHWLIPTKTGPRPKTQAFPPSIFNLFPDSRSRATPTAATPLGPPTVQLSAPRRGHDNKSGIVKHGPPKPSAVLGLPTVIARLPIDNCRDALLHLPASDIRALLTQYASGRPRSRTVAKLTNSYDANYGPRPDQLVSFDSLIFTIKASLHPFTHTSQAPGPEAIAPTLSPLKQTLNAPNGVFVNIRVLHSMALSPASLATKLRALQALVDIGDYLITRQLPFHPEQRALFLQEPLGPAFLGICASLSGPERCFVLHEVKGELEGQAVVFTAHGLFGGVVEGFELLMTAGSVVPEVQTMPVDLDPDEEDLDEDDDEEAEIDDSQELP